MARPRIVTDEERVEAAKAFTEGMRVRVVKTKYTKRLPYLQQGEAGTVAPRAAHFQPSAVIEVRMDRDPFSDGTTWPWYPDELEAIE